MKKAVFTIVAKNYIGLAKILKDSIKDKGLDFYIIVADELDRNNLTFEDYIIEGKKNLGYTEDEWVNMSFKYTLTEFCTAIKPASFLMLKEQGYDQILYFDPDIKVYSSLTPIFDLLSHYSVVLTPQIAEIHVKYKGHLKETDMHLNGIYNLGFIGIKINDSTTKMLEWWKVRLQTQCFMDKSRCLFTDQKWIDFIPGFQIKDGVYISHNLGMNLAPWNYFERKVYKKDDNWFVKSRESNSIEEYELIFTHFSGYKYKQMTSGQIKRQDRVLQPTNYPDIDLLIKEYSEEISRKKEMFNHYINLSYSYQTYTNGITIDRFHRRLYNGLIEMNQCIQNPFNSEGNSFFKLLSKSGLVNKKGSTSPDKVTMSNIQGVNKKKKYINILFKLLKKIIGYNRYVLFCRALPNYYRPEEHVFLLDQKSLNDAR